jgi:hypothetical protein
MFHYYVLSFAFGVYAAFNRYFIQSALFTVVFILSYFSISSNANIISDIKIGDGSRRTLFYQSYVKNINPVVEYAVNSDIDVIGINNAKPQTYDKEEIFPYNLFQAGPTAKSLILSKDKASRFGRIRLSPRFEASFITVRFDDNSFIIINLNLRGITLNEKEQVFENLGEFVLSQDEAVIVVGNFGIPVWSSMFNRFLLKTGLEVKNSIILTDGLRRFNLLNPPTVNLLAYRNVGIEKIRVLSKNQNPSYPVLFGLMVK